jgi:uncharacterized protein (DUF58 family)
MASAASRIEPTPRGRILFGIAVVSALGSWLSADANLRLAAALILAPLIVDFACTSRALAGIVVKVPFRQVVMGTPFLEHATLHHQGGGTIRDLLVQEPRTSQSPHLVRRLNTGESRQVPLTSRSRRRSHRLERVFELQTDWPLGLFRACATAVTRVDLVTEPARIDLPHEIAQAIAEAIADSNPSARLPGDEFHALREHLPAEPLRGIHALRSAGLGTLVRTVRRGAPPKEVAVVLDLRRPPSRSTRLGSRRFEWSMSACATLLDGLAVRQCPARLLIVGSDLARSRIGDPQQLQQALVTLSELQAVEHGPVSTSLRDDLEEVDRCFWIPAGGYDNAAERRDLTTQVLVIGGLE